MDHDMQEILNFDHIYACHTENVDISTENALHSIDNEQAQNEIMQLTLKLNNTQKENSKLKNLILIHLDIIQQQSDELTQKNKDIQSYQEEIEKLKSSLSHADDNSISLRVQNLNPPPLIHLTGQPVSTVTLIPDTSQVQFTNIANILNATTTLDNVISQKAPEKKIEPIDTYIDSISCANVGSIIDTRYIQCTDSVFDPQTNICYQNIVQPIVQTSVHSISHPVVTTISTGTTNSLRLKKIPVQFKNLTQTNASTPLQFQSNVRHKNTEFIVAKDNTTKINDFLTFNKKLKTIYTYEKNVKRNDKKVLKNPESLVEYNFTNKQQKTRDFTVKEKADPEIFSTTSTEIDIKPFKYTILNSNLSLKTDHEYINTNNIVNTKIQNKPNDIKTIQTRKFFTSSLKEKTSCRDFSYGESLANIDYKSNILEYLEGNNSNSHTETQIEELDWKDDIYNISNLSPSSHSPIEMPPKKAAKETYKDNILIRPDLMGKMMTSNVNSNSSYQYKNDENKIFNNYLNCQYTKSPKSTKKSKSRTTNMSQNNESLLYASSSSVCKPSASNKKKNVRRKRALSSASKVSTVSQSESPVPYSWSFSGQDFNILVDDIKPNYFISDFGSSQSYFSSSQLTTKDTTNETASLEVPSWRIKMFTPDEFVHTTENQDEEVYLKRHFKMENEEKRRKRWDFQMIREQRHIERLKQRQERRSSSGVKHSKNKVVCSTSGEELPTSFYPSPEDVYAIEICDSLPVTAFGECIPDLPPRSFQLPWVRSCSHSHSRSHSTAKKKSKPNKSDEE